MGWGAGIILNALYTESMEVKRNCENLYEGKEMNGYNRLKNILSKG